MRSCDCSTATLLAPPNCLVQHHSLPHTPVAPPAAGFLLAQRLGGLWVVVGLAGSIALSSSGFILQTCGFKEGSAGVRQAVAEWGRRGPRTARASAWLEQLLPGWLVCCVPLAGCQEVQPPPAS